MTNRYCHAESCTSLINYASDTDLFDQQLPGSLIEDGSYRQQRFVFTARGGRGIGLILVMCTNTDIGVFDFTEYTVEWN